MRYSVTARAWNAPNPPSFFSFLSSSSIQARREEGVIVEGFSRRDLPEMKKKKTVQTRNTIWGPSGGAEPNVLEPVELFPPLPSLPTVTTDRAQLLGLLQRLLDSQRELLDSQRESQRELLDSHRELLDSQREQTALLREIMEDARRAARVTPQLKVGNAKDFKDLGPLEFYGTEGILYADEWIENVERLLGIARIPDDLKVETTSMQLFDIARIWFTDELAVPDLTWETFKELFKKRFFPEVDRDALKSDFERLKQGNLTVDEYAAEFGRLNHFAEYTVRNPEHRARLFRKGLSQEIRVHVPTSATTYEKILEVAQDVEGDLGRRPKRDLDTYGGSSNMGSRKRPNPQH